MATTGQRGRAVATAALVLACFATPALVSGARAARAAASPPCTAAKKKVAYDTQMIARLNAQLKNILNKDVQKVRVRQINTALARFRADLAKAQAAKTKACGPSKTTTTPAPQLSDYEGTWKGSATGTLLGSPLDFDVEFTVRDGLIVGDGLSGHIDAATGDAELWHVDWSSYVKVSVTCTPKPKTVPVHFNTNGTATGVANSITCKPQNADVRAVYGDWTGGLTEAHRTGP